MVLLEDGADINHRVDIGRSRCVPADRRFCRAREKLTQGPYPGGRFARVLVAAKDENTPAAIRLDDMAQGHWFAIRKPNDRCRMKTHADHQAFGQMLMSRFGGNE